MFTSSPSLLTVVSSVSPQKPAINGLPPTPKVLVSSPCLLPFISHLDATVKLVYIPVSVLSTPGRKRTQVRSRTFFEASFRKTLLTSTCS